MRRDRSLRHALAMALAAATLSACDSPLAPPQAGMDGPAFARGGRPASETLDRATTFAWAMGDYAIRPDGRFTTTYAHFGDETFSAYTHDLCGVEAVIQLDNGGGDAFLGPDKDWNRVSRTDKNTTCAVDGTPAPRRLTAVYPDGSGTDDVFNLYARRLWFFDDYDPNDPVFANWVGTMDFRTGPLCGSLWFNPTRHPGSANVSISRTTIDGRSAFIIESDPQSGHLAYCTNRDALIAVPFRLVVEDRGPR